MFPNFIVIGAAKCGTSSLCDLLSGHPDVFFSRPKEPSYFSNMERYGDDDFRKEYENLFADVTTETMIGEGTTNYTHPKNASVVAERIAGSLPDIKLIFMARHPIRRLESDWRMRCYEGWAPPDINDAIRDNESLITHSLYSKNLTPYLQKFPSQQIHIIVLEELSANPSGVLEGSMDFLGIDSSVELEDSTRRRNVSRDFRKDTSLTAKMRKSATLARIRDSLPTGVTRVVKKLLTKELPYDPQWDDECLEFVRASLREDAAEFLELCDKKPDFWNLTRR